MTFTELTEEIRRVGGFGDSTEDDASVEAAAKMGLRMIGRSGAWPWLKTTITIPLVASTHNYVISSVCPLIFRFDTHSFRYAGRDTYLEWATEKEIDFKLEPTWRDTGATTGTPSYICHMGAELWIAPKPSVTHIASYPNVYGQGWQIENFAGTAGINGGNLLLPDEFSQVAVHASLSYLWEEEDDPRSTAMLQRFNQIDLPQMAAVIDVGQFDRMRTPAWNYHEVSGDSYYGDGN